MKSYLKIILSIFIASLSLAIIAAIVSAVVMVFKGEFDIRGITLPFVFAWFGFLIFGIPGSIIWLISFLALKRSPLEKAKRHYVAVVISIIVCTPIVMYIESGINLKAIGESLFLLVFIIPVALTGLFIHWFLFVREKT